MVMEAKSASESRRLIWRVIGKSVMGATHKRANLPNQDAILWWPEKGEGPPLVLAISDGHGSSKCFRSDVGSRLAVSSATRLIGEFLKSVESLKDTPRQLSESAISRMAEEHLPQKITRAWVEEVKNHYAEHPFLDEELQALEEKDGYKARQAVEANPQLAYGATLLSVLVTDYYILYLQIGDGDILIVDEMGAVKRPMSKDERLIANETTSLSSQEAWADFRVECQWLQLGQLPALLLLSTDGYFNSFSDEANFQKIGPDYLQMIRESGLHSVYQNLERWLSESSSKGSGDDITLGLIKRREQGDKEWADELEGAVTAIVGKVGEHDTQLSELSSITKKLTECLEGQQAALRDCESKISDQQSASNHLEEVIEKNTEDVGEVSRRLQEVERELVRLRQVEDDNKQITGSVLRLRWGIAFVFLMAIIGIVLAVIVLVRTSSTTHQPLPAGRGTNASREESKRETQTAGAIITGSPRFATGAGGSSARSTAK
jgi:serine/threonine protein phosphatase PrpC